MPPPPMKDKNMRLLLIGTLAISSGIAAAVVEVDDTFQVSNDEDRNRLLDYLEEIDSVIDTSETSIQVLADGTDVPALIDQDGDALQIGEYALPPREEVDEPVENILDNDDERTHGDDSAIDD